MTFSYKTTNQIADAISKEIVEELNKKIFDVNVEFIFKHTLESIKQKFNNQIDDELAESLSFRILENMQVENSGPIFEATNN